MLRHFGRTRLNNVDQRLYALYNRRFLSEKSVEPASKPAETAYDDASIIRRTYQPTNFERKLLVWVGRYKTVEEIPRVVPAETIEKARNKGRIKVSNYMILATIVGCFCFAWLGKRASQQGESVIKHNLDWHKKYNEEKKQ